MTIPAEVEAAVMTRMEELRSRLLPRGTPLTDAPVSHCGLSLREWTELCWLEWHAATPVPTGPPAIEQKAFATARDNYGWRSLRGTHYLGQGNK